VRQHAKCWCGGQRRPAQQLVVTPVPEKHATQFQQRTKQVVEKAHEGRKGGCSVCTYPQVKRVERPAQTEQKTGDRATVRKKKLVWKAWWW